MEDKHLSKKDRGKSLILLLYPKPRFYTYSDHPPLGILTIAAPLVEAGYEVVILDEQVEENFDETLTQILKRNPICVGISSMSGSHIKVALRICRQIKEQTNIPVILGGIHASISPESSIQSEFVDVIVFDDGEETFPKLVKAYENNRDLSGIDGIAYKKNGEIFFNKPAPPADIQKLPRLPYYLMKVEKYIIGCLHTWAIKQNALAMETSRGCPYQCIFCTESIRKKKWRALPPKRIVGDIKYYKSRYNIDQFLFIDDNFFGNKTRANEIVNLLIEQNIDIKWYTNVRADFLCKMGLPFLKKLEQSGCKMLTFGAESGSQKILTLIDKRGDVKDLLKINKLIKHTTIIPHFVTIRGFPNEAEEDIRKTFLLCFQLLHGNKKAFCDSLHLIPTPGTKIMELCLGEKAKEYTLEDWEKIFDIGRMATKPDWIMEETYQFMKKHEGYLAIIFRAHRMNLAGFDYTLFRFILKIIILSFKWKFSYQLMNFFVTKFSDTLLHKMGIFKDGKNKLINEFEQQRQLRKKVVRAKRKIGKKTPAHFDYSVVIPFYNTRFELNLVLAGLAHQDYDRNKFEVVLVDDGSEQSINDLLQRYSDMLFIRYIRQDHTGNRGFNRNAGVKKSRGKKIIFIDSDIIPENNLISAFDAATRNKPRLVSIGFRSFLSNMDRKFLTPACVENDCAGLKKFPLRLDSRLKTYDYEKETGNVMDGKWQLLYTNNVCIPKQEFERVGGFDEVFSRNWGAEDIELGFRLYQHGCTLEMNRDSHGFHIFHLENWKERTKSLEDNYSLFIHKHPHWAVELFSKEYKILVFKMIELQNKIKKREHIISQINDTDKVIDLLPHKSLLCGIDDKKLLQSDKVEKAFIPETSLSSPKILNWMGINTEYPDHYFEMALLSGKYESINYGLSRMLYREITRISKRVIIIHDHTDITGSLASGKPGTFSSPKKILFLVSPAQNYSIYRHYLNLAVALHKKGVKTGYNVSLDSFQDIDPNIGIMRTTNEEKINIISSLAAHELEFIEDSIPAIIDMTILKGTTKCMGPRILWEEIVYQNQVKEIISDILPLVQSVSTRRSGDRKLYPENTPIDYIPIGIDKQKIETIKAKGKNGKKRFRILWADCYTDFHSHLDLLLLSFTELFRDKDDIELKIIHTGKNTFFTQNNRIDSNKLFNDNYLKLYNKYHMVKNITFHQTELSDEAYSREIYECDCFINLNSVLKINSWVLESVAFGKKPIIPDNQNYNGYFTDQQCLKVKTYSDSALVASLSLYAAPLSNNGGPRSCLVDIPVKESLDEILNTIYHQKDVLCIEQQSVKEFVSEHDWMITAEKVIKLL